MIQFDHNEFPALPPDLRHVDASLAEMAAREAMPVGLADRTYEASVTALPKQRLRLRGRIQTTSVHRPLRFHRTAWGQLAMAASVALAFVIGAMFLSDQPVLQDMSGMTAHHGESSTVVTPVALTRPALLSREAEQELFGANFNGDRFAYIVETRDVTHSDVLRDLNRLLDDLEL